MAFEKLMAFLGLNAEAFKTELRNAEKEAKKTGESFERVLGERTGQKIAQMFSQGLGASIKGMAGEGLKAGVAFAAVKKMIWDIAGEIDHIADRWKEISLGSKKLGVDSGTYQDREYQAGKSGTDIGTVSGAYRHINSIIAQARQGDFDALAALQQLGVSQKEVNSGAATADKIFERIAQTLNGSKHSVEDMAAAIKVMGKGSDVLIPGMENGTFSQQLNPFKIDEETGKSASEIKGNVKLWKQLTGQVWEEIVASEMHDSLVIKDLNAASEHLRNSLGIWKRPEKSENLKSQEMLAAAETKMEREDKENARRETFAALTATARIVELKKEEARIEKEIRAAKSNTERANLVRELGDTHAMRAQAEKERSKQGVAIQKLALETAEIYRKGALSALTDEQKLTEQVKDRIKLQKQYENEADPLKKAELGKQFAQQIVDTNEAAIKLAKDQQVKFDKPDINSLQKIGAYSNGSGINEQLLLGRQQLTLQSRANDLQRQILDAIKSGRSSGSSSWGGDLRL